MAFYGTFKYGTLDYGTKYSIYIGGVERSEYVAHGSLQISSAINERSTATIDIIDETGTYRPNVGDIFKVYDGETLIFAGTIDDLPEVVIKGTSGLQYSNVPIVDYNQIADRILVADSYESVSAGSIVNDIITSYLAGEGVTAGTVQTGVTVSKAVFNYMYASACLDELSELTGFQWKINADKTLDFFERGTYTGTAINETANRPRAGTVKIKRSRASYRNRQYLTAGKGVATAETRTFKGDGATQTFTLPLPIAVVPTITVDSVSKTVGIRGVETGKDWYWQKNSNDVSQDSSGTKLTSSNTLSITYQGYYPIIVVAESPSEIASRASIEGGDGVYESIASKSSIDTSAAALEYTSGLLRRYANISKTITLESYTAYEAGQLVNVNFPTHGISEDMLVSSVKVTTLGAGEDMRLIYSVKLVSGESFGGWTNFFKKLVENNSTYTIRENEVLVKLIVFKDVFAVPVMADTMTYSLHQYLICSTTTYCGTGVII